MGDITNFMNWWIGQVVRIFTFTFNTLDGITFSGTSILKIMIFIIIIGALTKVVLTIPGQTINMLANEREQYEHKRQLRQIVEKEKTIDKLKGRK